MANTVKNMWLHPEGSSSDVVLPYTTVDNIKIKNGNQYLEFEDDYNNVKTTINANKTESDNSFRAVNNRIDQIVISTEPATQTTDGLMAKEDKIKMDSIESSANNYVLPLATGVALGGVKVDGDTIELDQNGILQVVQPNTIEGLSDVSTDDLSDGQILAYNSIDGEWQNIDIPVVGGAHFLNDLNDVTISNLTDAQILKYDITSHKWINVNNSAEPTPMTTAEIEALFE